jgi:hypothetical protein
MSNRITVYGHLGKDAEVKDVNGRRVMEFSIASNHKIKGEKVVVWRKVTFWDDNYRKIEEYLKKGSGLIVSGEELPPTIYEGKVQLTMTGKDIMFSPFGNGSEKKDGFVAEPAKEESRLPGLPPC